jgi:hypothetical protein
MPDFHELLKTLLLAALVGYAALNYHDRIVAEHRTVSLHSGLDP